MPANKPEDCDLLVVKAISEGNIEAALALYEPDATFAPEVGKSVQGTAAVREVLNGFMAMKPTLNVTVPNVYQSGDIAILVSNWTMKGTDPDGNPVEESGKGTEVVRRQADGTWKFIIDNPHGTA